MPEGLFAFPLDSNDSLSPVRGGGACCAARRKDVDGDEANESESSPFRELSSDIQRGARITGWYQQAEVVPETRPFRNGCASIHAAPPHTPGYPCANSAASLFAGSDSSAG